jgi:hypothetical protein
MCSTFNRSNISRIYSGGSSPTNLLRDAQEESKRSTPMSSGINSISQPMVLKKRIGRDIAISDDVEKADDAQANVSIVGEKKATTRYFLWPHVVMRQHDQATWVFDPRLGKSRKTGTVRIFKER